MVLEPFTAGATFVTLLQGTEEPRKKAKEIWRGYKRKGQYSEEIDELSTELYSSLENKIRERAQNRDDETLERIADRWEDIAKDLDDSSDELNLFFEEEGEAVGKMTQAIVRISETDEPEDALAQRLKEPVREGYRDALKEFRNSVRDTKLEQNFRQEYEINVIDKLNEAINRLRTESYERFPSDGIEDAKEELFRQGGITGNLSYVERPEVDSVGDSEKLLVTGRKGTGKTRVLSRLLKEFGSEVDEVVVIGKEFQNPNDVSALASDRFEGDVLLVWDDIHGISEERNIFRDAVSKLDSTLREDGHSLNVLAASRSEEYESLPRIGRWEEDRVWSEFDRLDLLPLEEEEAGVLAGILEEALGEYGVSAEEDDVKIELLRKAYENDPSPFYIVSVIKRVADDDAELTHDTVEELPENALDIWKENYSNLDRSEKKVLQLIDLLSEIGFPYHSLILKELYDRALEEDDFRGAVESLIEKDWFVNPDVETGVPDDDITYRVHDICVEAVENGLGEFEVEDISKYLLDNGIKVPSGFERDRLYAHLHNGIGLVLFRQFERLSEQAEEHYQKAIEINPEYAEAYNNYALLLKNELGRPEEAEKKFKKAIEINPENAEAYNNYGVLLEEELGDPEEAEKKYQKAIEINPEYAKAYYNYALLLEEELGDPEEAREKYESSVSLWIQKGVIRNALNDLKTLVRLCRRLEDEEGVVENCESALDILDEAPQLDEDGTEHLWFRSIQTLAEPEDIEATELYRLALRNVLETNGRQVISISTEAWGRHGEHGKGSEEHRASVAAGVLLAAHAEMFDIGYSSEDIFTEIDEEDVYTPENSVYEYLTEGKTEATPEELLSEAEELDEQGEQVPAIEYQAFATVLNALN